VDVTERLTLALNSRSSSGDRPDPEQFLAEFFSEIGIARGTADRSAASRKGCLQSAGAEEDDQEAWITAPTREDLLEELWGLLPAAATEKEQEKKGGIYRRIAEIVEQVDDETAAFVWWLHAAHAGDEVAVAIVDELALDPSAERPSVLQSIHQLQNTTR
jgi:hypothetical protein